MIAEPCEVCRGEGRVRGERTVTVEIPAGVSANNYLTLRGQGAAGPAQRADGRSARDARHQGRRAVRAPGRRSDLRSRRSRSPRRRSAADQGAHAVRRGRREGRRRHPAGDGAPAPGPRAADAGPGWQGRPARPGARVDAGAADARSRNGCSGSWPSSRASRPSARRDSGPSSRKRSAHELVGHRRAARAPRREEVGAWLVARTGQAVEERDDGTLVTFAADEQAADALVAALRLGGAVAGRDRPPAARAGGLVDPLARRTRRRAASAGSRWCRPGSTRLDAEPGRPSCSIPRPRSAAGSTAPPAPP